GLTQMFEASSPQRPATNSSALLTSPHLGLTSPPIPAEALAKIPLNSGFQGSRIAHHYVSVDESQAERERGRRKITSSVDNEDDDEFGAAPPALLAKLRGRQRERDSVERFKEISVTRPPTKGKRGRQPKNRLVEPLYPLIHEESFSIAI